MTTRSLLLPEALVELEPVLRLAQSRIRTKALQALNSAQRLRLLAARALGPATSVLGDCWPRGPLPAPSESAPKMLPSFPVARFPVLHSPLAGWFRLNHSPRASLLQL